jgi:uncharacterized protein YggE
MKYYILTSFWFLLLPSAFSQPVFENIPLLTVTGEAIVKVVPNQAIISVRVMRKVDVASINAASESFLFNKEDADIKFLGSDNQEVFSTIIEADAREKPVVFIKEFIVTVNNIGMLSKVVLELLRFNFTNIYSIRYRLSNLPELQNKVRHLAIANAKSIADNYAGQIGQAIGKVHLLKEEEVTISNWYVEKYKSHEEVLKSNYLYNPGYITIPCKVTVSYRLQQ